MQRSTGLLYSNDDDDALQIRLEVDQCGGRTKRALPSAVGCFPSSSSSFFSVGRCSPAPPAPRRKGCGAHGSRRGSAASEAPRDHDTTQHHKLLLKARLSVKISHIRFYRLSFYPAEVIEELKIELSRGSDYHKSMSNLLYQTEIDRLDDVMTFSSDCWNLKKYNRFYYSKRRESGQVWLAGAARPPINHNNSPAAAQRTMARRCQGITSGAPRFCCHKLSIPVLCRRWNRLMMTGNIRHTRDTPLRPHAAAGGASIGRRASAIKALHKIVYRFPLGQHVDEKEVCKHIRKLRTDKSPGPDCVQNKVLKAGAVLLTSSLTYLSDRVLDTGQRFSIRPTAQLCLACARTRRSLTRERPSLRPAPGRRDVRVRRAFKARLSATNTFHCVANAVMGCGGDSGAARGARARPGPPNLWRICCSARRAARPAGSVPRAAREDVVALAYAARARLPARDRRHIAKLRGSVAMGSLC
ncbi:hypothetical protein EVAR_11792_1 [Eumeta japonica]|uniref:Uncharacterized protein n=1 Tax=Eumeta variegata TaxID=151549 RepID=A0A4C1UQ38_EUMVA|nr:hypothetical protein EVAR_11792_1 [Eumeta japonica]